jgi:hypothetical protein
MKIAVFTAPGDYEHEHRFAEHEAEEREKPEITPCLTSLMVLGLTSRFPAVRCSRGTGE